MSYQKRVTFDCEFSGQRRAYADTTTEGRLIIESKVVGQDWRPFDVSEGNAKSYLKALVGFSEPGEEPDPFSPVLRTFEKVEPGIWNVYIVSRYND